MFEFNLEVFVFNLQKVQTKYRAHYFESSFTPNYVTKASLPLPPSTPFPFSFFHQFAFFPLFLSLTLPASVAVLRKYS